MRRTVLLTLLGGVALASPGLVAAGQPQAISIVAHSELGCPTATSCVFTVSGAVNDTGAIVTESVHATALPAPVVGTAQYVRTFVGLDGSITIQLETIIRPTDVPWLWHEEGHWIVVGATGAYAGMRGQGQESGTRDFAAQALDVVYSGQLH